MATPPPAKRAKIDDERTFQQAMGSEVVELIVGPEKKKFIVHKDLLCSKVPYFEKMFKGGYSEATNNSAAFPEDNVECFDLLLGWIYNGRLRALTADTKNANGVRVISWSMSDFYSFTDKICLPDLQDYALDLYINMAEKGNTLPDVSHIKELYKCSTANSGIRKFASASFRKALTLQDENLWLMDDMQKLLAENLDLRVDFLTSIREGEEVKDPRQVPRCTFHQHGDRKGCYLEVGKETK
ncbi:hypothetical protein VTL71DRAFT_3729 [Oculimacula yallundae]|uniref:BTB domain-containing protein n=1 Tax=Oculimacula yallundae TaxID=86028 RepID=A0ABR4C503_9HELO